MAIPQRWEGTHLIGGAGHEAPDSTAPDTFFQDASDLWDEREATQRGQDIAERRIEEVVIESGLAPQTLSYPERSQPFSVVGGGGENGKQLPRHIGFEHLGGQR